MLVEDIDVVEHPGKGYFYTWCDNRWEGSRTYDRLFVNEAWLS